MDIKDLVTNNIIRSMSLELDKDQLQKLSYVLANSFKDLDISVHEECTVPVLYEGGNRLIDSFIANKKLKGCTETTLKRYDYVTKRFYEYVNGKNLVDVTTTDIKCFLAAYSASGASSSSVDGFRLCLNSFYAWMVLEEIIERNPCAKIPKIKVDIKVKTPVTNNDVIKLRDKCVDIREKVFVDLLECSGLRCMEIPTIKISDIDFVKKSILVHGKGKKERLILVNDTFIEHAKQYLDERQKNGCNNPYLIARLRDNGTNNPLSKDAIHEMLKKISGRAQVDVHVHDMRRRFATVLNKQGMNLFYIQKLLGHTSIATTQIYVNNSIENISQEYSKFMI